MLFTSLLLLALADPPATPTPAASPPATTPPATAAPAATDEDPRVKILVLDARSGDLTADQLHTLSGLLTARVARFPSANVVSSSDLREMLELEAQKQSAGCDDGGNACLAELAGALGADLVIASRAGKLGSTFVFTSQIFDPRKGDAVGRMSIEAYALEDLVEKIGPALDDVLRSVLMEEPGNQAAVVSRDAREPAKHGGGPHPALLWGGVAGASVGVVSAVGGSVPALLFNRSKSDLESLRRAYTGDAATRTDAAQKQEDARAQAAAYDNVGRWFVTGGVVLVIAGAAAVTSSFFVPTEETEAP